MEWNPNEFFRASIYRHTEEVDWQPCTQAMIRELALSAEFDIDFIGLRGPAPLLLKNPDVSSLLGQAHGILFKRCSLKIARFHYFKRCLVFAKIGKVIFYH